MFVWYFRHKGLWTIASWEIQLYSQNTPLIARYIHCCNNWVMVVSSKLVQQQVPAGACDLRIKAGPLLILGAAAPVNYGVLRQAVTPSGATLASTTTINNVLRPVLWTRTYPETFWEVSRCRLPHGKAISLVRRPSLLLHDTSIILRIVRRVSSLELVS